MRRTALVISLSLMLLGACSSKGSPAPAPGPATVAGAEEAATVDGVLAGLDGVMGDLQRILVREKRLSTDVTDRLRAIYAGPELLNQIDAFRSDVADGLVGYKNPPGNRVTKVSRLITVGPDCIFVQASRDYSPVTSGVAPRATSVFVVLATKTDADDPKRLNPTPWTMLY